MDDLFLVREHVFCYNIHKGAAKNGRTVLSNLGVQALIALVALCGGAGYMLGKDIQKAKK